MASEPNVSAQMDAWRAALPNRRKPVILVCGSTGRGKTTLINTLFGAEVGRVGHFARGTEKDELYEWESHGTHIDVVDLPGLGDSPRNDRRFAEIYRQRVRSADAFLVVTTPPRPVDSGTLKTIRVLINARVPRNKIVVAINRLTTIDVDGHQVRINGLDGPATGEDISLIDQCCTSATKSFADENLRFDASSIVPFDAASGWNMFRVLDALLERLPLEAMPEWRAVTEAAASEARRRQRKSVAQERALLARERAAFEAEVEATRIKAKKAAKRRRERDRIRAVKAIATEDHEEGRRAQIELASVRRDLDRLASQQNQISQALGAGRGEISSERAAVDVHEAQAADALARAEREYRRVERKNQDSVALALASLGALQSRAQHAESLARESEVARQSAEQRLFESRQRDLDRQEQAVAELQKKQAEHNQKIASRTGQLLAKAIGGNAAGALIQAAQTGGRFLRRLFGG